ncbi:MAG: hypothetical protein GY774_28655 [Planctomycetes bacterium]|nr:hypothetical protein [Planctomycetota bacterium]
MSVNGAINNHDGDMTLVPTLIIEFGPPTDEVRREAEYPTPWERTGRSIPTQPHRVYNSSLTMAAGVTPAVQRRSG